MTESLRDRMAQFLYETAAHVPATYDEADIGFWNAIADALLVSEEWQAREAVVEAAGEYKSAETIDQAQLAAEHLLEAFARLDAVRGEETTR